MDRTENPYLNTMRLSVSLSPVLIIGLVILHLISLFLPWLSGLSLLYKFTFLAIPIFSMVYYLNKYRFVSTEKRVSELILGSDDGWQVKMEGGNCYPAVLNSELFVHPWLTVISLTYNQTKSSFIFTPDVIGPDRFRRLRVRLKYKAC